MWWIIGILVVIIVNVTIMCALIVASATDDKWIGDKQYEQSN